MTNKRQFITNVKEIAVAIKKVHPDASVEMIGYDGEQLAVSRIFNNE
jgi:hypothetical protein